MADTPVLDRFETVKLSKLLSYVLRHGAQKEKLVLRSDGYVAVRDLLARPKFKQVTLEQIKYVVDNNDKKRFTLIEEQGEYWIRANQGHSIKIVNQEALLERISEPLPVAVHGTSFESWESIKREGLLRMKRNHIHLAPGLPGHDGVISGMRKNSQVYIYIDMAKAMADGVVFYKSSNNVILTEGLNGCLKPIHFAKVEDKEGRSLLSMKE